MGRLREAALDGLAVSLTGGVLVVLVNAACDRARRLATFPGINDDADFVEVPFLVASVSEPCAKTAVVSYRGHEARRPITDGFVVAAFWDQSEAASSEPVFEPGGGPLTATVEFIPEHELPPAPELPRIERYE